MVHAIEAHHDEVRPQTVEAVLVIAADAISASRPGARGESLEHYIKRLESLEELAAFEARASRGRTRCRRAARSASWSARARSTTRGGAHLARDRARDRDQLEYPGQVKVTVIRESRSVDVARNHTAVQNGEGNGHLHAAENTIAPPHT